MDSAVRIVKNKNELKKAYEDKVDKIVITGDFAKKVNKAKVICKMTPAKLAVLGAALTAAGSGIAISSLTLGASSVIGIAAAVPAAAKTGISISSIIQLSIFSTSLKTKLPKTKFFNVLLLSKERNFMQLVTFFSI